MTEDADRQALANSGNKNGLEDVVQRDRDLYVKCFGWRSAFFASGGNPPDISHKTSNKGKSDD